MNNFDVDLVYLWVDGNDPEFRARRNSALERAEEQADSNCEGRIADSDEMKYSLRAVEKYAPWVRKIFIVSNGNAPYWMDVAHPKIHIINQDDLIPEECRPTFNSVVIEHCLHKIPGLAEHFLYSNDDMFINKPVVKEDFFAEDGSPVIRLNRRFFRRFTLWLKKRVLGRKISTYNKTILRAGHLVESMTGKFLAHKPHHNIDAFTKTLYKDTFETYQGEITPTLSNRFRSDNDIQRVIYSYHPIATGKVRPTFVNRKTSFHLHIDNHRQYARLEKTQPMLFCLNDSQYANDEDRYIMRDFLEKRFPDKSVFEIV